MEITLNHYNDEDVKTDKVLNVVDSDSTEISEEDAQELIQAALRLLDARYYGLDLTPYLDDLQSAADDNALAMPSEED
jgi:hypothetical protein